MDTTLLKSYVDRGWSIIPIEARSKAAHHAMFSWRLYSEEKVSWEAVEGWFSMFPDSNVAVVTGQLSGVLVVGVDTPDAMEKLREYLPTGFTPPAVKTARGQHWYFKYPEQYHLTNFGYPFEGFDIRGEDGYALLPGSIHPSGVVYEWVDAPGEALPEVPPVLLGFLLACVDQKGVEGMDEGCSHGCDDDDDYDPSEDDFSDYYDGYDDDDYYEDDDTVGELTFLEYQVQAKQTAIYPKEMALGYLGLGISGEAGEVAGKIKKVYRDDKGVISVEGRKALLEEIGDVLWYCAMLAVELGSDLEEIAGDNLEKLADRSNRDVLGGSGDER